MFVLSEHKSCKKIRAIFCKILFSLLEKSRIYLILLSEVIAAKNCDGLINSELFYI